LARLRFRLGLGLDPAGNLICALSIDKGRVGLHPEPCGELQVKLEARLRAERDDRRQHHRFPSHLRQRQSGHHGGPRGLEKLWIVEHTVEAFVIVGQFPLLDNRGEHLARWQMVGQVAQEPGQPAEHLRGLKYLTRHRHGHHNLLDIHQRLLVPPAWHHD
jgi:hypothetical protein